MSWSVNLVGSQPAVLAKIEAEFDKYTCKNAEEQAIKNSARDICRAAVAGISPDKAVKVEAAGYAHQYADDRSQTVSLKVEPVYGFVA